MELQPMSINIDLMIENKKVISVTTQQNEITVVKTPTATIITTRDNIFLKITGVPFYKKILATQVPVGTSYAVLKEIKRIEIDSPENADEICLEQVARFINLRKLDSMTLCGAGAESLCRHLKGHIKYIRLISKNSLDFEPKETNSAPDMKDFCHFIRINQIKNVTIIGSGIAEFLKNININLDALELNFKSLLRFTMPHNPKPIHVHTLMLRSNIQQVYGNRRKIARQL